MQQILKSYFFKAKTTNIPIHTFIHTQFGKNKFFRRKEIEHAQKITILNFNITSNAQLNNYVFFCRNFYFLLLQVNYINY